MKALLAPIIFAIFFNVSFAVELTTNTLLDVEKKVLEKNKKYGVKNVLVVFDIDNTIITMPQSLGSDQWFTWQANECLSGTKKPFCVAQTLDDLIDIQLQLFTLSNMIPTEPITLQTIRNIQSYGNTVILLTSRSSHMRDVTQRALDLNGFDFKTNTLNIKDNVYTYLPYDINKYKNFSLTEIDVKEGGLSHAREVSFINGIYMTAGQHKGAMLKTLLHRSGQKFKSIIFSDDHLKHTQRVHAFMSRVPGVDITTFRYGAIDPEVKAFNESSKSDVIDAWNELRKSVSKVLK